MTLPGRQVVAIRVPRLTLRTRLTVLYGALFSASVAAIVAVSELLWPNFLREHASQAAPVGTPTSPGPGYIGSTGYSVSVQSVLFLAVLIALSLGVGWLVAGRNLRPLRAIIATSRDISVRNLHQRLNLTGPRDEFTELGATLDDLFGRLEASFESQRRFVANASHELRTPLAAGRTLLQVALADPDADTQAPALRLPAGAGPRRPAGAPDRGAAHAGKQRARRRAVGALRPGRDRREGHRGPRPGGGRPGPGHRGHARPRACHR